MTTHGKNITPFEEICLEIDDLYDEAKNWADGTALENDEQHDAVSKLYDALHQAGKRADELRKGEKQPLDERVKAIQDRYNPYIQPKKGKVDKAKASLGELLSEWRTSIEAKKRAAAEEVTRIAEEERRKANEAIQTSKGDLQAREIAESQLEQAKQAEKLAASAGRYAATGNGLRTYHEPVLTDLNAAIQHYWRTNRAEFEALVCTLAAKDARAGRREIPGFEIIERKKAI